VAVGIVAVFLTPDDGSRAHLVSMWVSPERRKARIGTALIDAVLRWSRDHGAQSVELWVTSDVPAPQLFVRLNVVDSTGRSTNITDTLATVRADPVTPTLVTATLPPTCVRVYAGERLRLVVAGGAFPRFARNPGTGESPVTATTFRVAHIDIHHDAAHPSKVVLPRIPVPTSNA